MESYRNKHYGLVGKTVKVKDRLIKGGAYPWEGCEVPVLITAEYPSFLLGTVLPHRNPRGFGTSRPYPITIDKHEIYIGNMILNGGKVK